MFLQQLVFAAVPTIGVGGDRRELQTELIEL